MLPTLGLKRGTCVWGLWCWVSAGNVWLVNIQDDRAGGGVGMWEKMNLSVGQGSLSMRKKNEEDCALGSHRGWNKRPWIGGGGCSSGSGPGLSICSDRWGGGTPLSGFPGCWWTADPFVPQRLVVHFWNVVASEGHSLSHPQCIMDGCVPSVTAAPCPTLSLLCYEASALGASFRPFFRDGESDVFTVFRGGLTGSLASSCNDGSLYIATVWQKIEAIG